MSREIGAPYHRATMPASHPTPRSGIAFYRERDERVQRLLADHPATSGILASLGWFPTRDKARKRLRRLQARKRVRLVGAVCRKAGRPEQVYCGWRPAPDALTHEVELTELCLRIDAGGLVRGPRATDEQLRPDAELTISGQRYLLEFDRGTMGYRQIERRFRVYERCPDFVLWVCSTPERREGMRSRAGMLRSTALFATRDEAMANPHAPVWRDVDGATVALPRQR
jgi:hypothetical protein